MINEETRRTIECQYGTLFALDDKGKRITMFNEQGFARLFHTSVNLVYLPQENAFYLYESKTGLWKQRSSEEMSDLLGLFLHECAETWNIEAIEGKRKQSVLSSIMKFLKAAGTDRNFFKTTGKIFIHCANGILKLDETGTWQLSPFDPAYRSRNRCEIVYRFGATCPRFLTELLRPLIEDDDATLLQQYIGQCLTGKNITQSILLLTGSGGSGKGTLANITESLIGEGNFTQIRPGQSTGRFENSFFMNKTLLTGKESNASFFTANGMQVLKSLVGDDKLRAEVKNSSRHEMIDGVYNVFIVGNTPPVMEFESKDDQSAWRRRLRWVRSKNHKPLVPIPNFAEKLMDEEGSGILNWALEGARKIILSGSSTLPCSDLQAKKLDYLFHAAEPLDFFLDMMIEKKYGTTISGADLFLHFTNFTRAMHWRPWTQREFQRKMPDAMLRHFGTPLRRDIPRLRADGKNTNCSGYYHVAFRQRE